MATTPLPPAPQRSFASDNAAGAHPSVMEAVAPANHRHAIAYGDDDETRRCEDAFRELFGRDVTTLLTFNGTGANVTALTTLVRPGDAVICTDWAHINVDETGAPERVAGCKLIDVPCPDGKMLPGQIEEQSHALGVMHHAQPAVVSLTQGTELGGVYSLDEMAALCETARRYGMYVHVDGARIANAVVALGGTVDVLRELTAQVDVISFGGTKNGALAAEAVVFVDPEHAARARYVRKSVTQLPSKMRMLAAQFNALLDGELWLDLARHANARAADLHTRTVEIPGVHHDGPPAMNGVFPVLPPSAIEPLREWCFFFDWSAPRHQVRWMTAWDTTTGDVERFAAGVRQVLDDCN
jgi:threonine aldolase